MNEIRKREIAVGMNSYNTNSNINNNSTGAENDYIL
jgi:hypothetical protein